MQPSFNTSTQEAAEVKTECGDGNFAASGRTARGEGGMVKDEG